jgi:hypothetical protein
MGAPELEEALERGYDAALGVLHSLPAELVGPKAPVVPLKPQPTAQPEEKAVRAPRRR